MNKCLYIIIVSWYEVYRRKIETEHTFVYSVS